jgi:polysaccharide biosynthesis/export protein
MKQITFLLSAVLLIAASCTSQKKLAYLNNLPETNGEEYFTMDVPGYKIQPRDILYITLRAMNTEGMIQDFLSGGRASGTSMQFESSQYISGYDVDSKGNINLPVLGEFKAEGFTIEELRDTLQSKFLKNYPNSTLECKLLSFKFTVIGEIRTPGTYVNYNNYLTVLEAIGRAGGIGDYGKRDRILVVRPTERGTKTFRLNLHDKNILSSEAYFLLPNDVVIVETERKKIFNMNMPTISFAISTVTGILTTTLLLINFFGK